MNRLLYVLRWPVVLLLVVVALPFAFVIAVMEADQELLGCWLDFAREMLLEW